MKHTSQPLVAAYKGCYLLHKPEERKEAVKLLKERRLIILYLSERFVKYFLQKYKYFHKSEENT